MELFSKITRLYGRSVGALLALGAALAGTLFLGHSQHSSPSRIWAHRDAGNISSVKAGRKDNTPSSALERELSDCGGELIPDALETFLFAQSLADFPVGGSYDDLVRAHDGPGLHEVGLPPGSPFNRRTLSALKLGERHALQFVALKRGGTFLKPPPGTRLRQGDLLLVMGKARDARALRVRLEA